MSICILHLCDVHITTSDHEALSYAKPMTDALRARGLSPSILIVALVGDIAFSGTAEQYNLANAFVDTLLTNLKELYPNTSLPVILTPGNHDCDFTRVDDIVQEQMFKKASNPLDINGTILQSHLVLQNNFFNFATRHNPEITTNAEKLALRKVFSSKNHHTIALTTYNTAWASQLHETVGALRYPSHFPHPEQSPVADVEVALFHHPYNWLEPSNAREFRNRIESCYDVVLTGHEHAHDLSSRTTDSSHVLYLAGTPLHDTSVADNGFSLIEIDYPQKTWRYITFRRQDDNFVPTSATFSESPFVRNQKVLQRRFENNTAFLSELNENGSGFYCKDRKLSLKDIFVYPELQQRPTQRKLDAKQISPSKIKPNDVIDFVTNFPKVLIFGADKTGKSALARSLYCDLQLKKNLIPLLLSSSDFGSSGKLDDTLRNAISKQYRPDAVESFLQHPTDHKILIIDDFDKVSNSKSKTMAILESLERRFSRLIILVDEFYDLADIITDGKGSLFVEYRQYSLLEFNRIQRALLIDKWLRLSLPSLEDAEFSRELASKERNMDMILGRQLVPALPIFILSILQRMEQIRDHNAGLGSYGELYESLITERLAKISGRSTDIGMYYKILSLVAFYMFDHDQDRMNSFEIDGVVSRYAVDYGLRVDSESLTDKLCKAEILQTDSGTFEFKYQYYRNYFVARYFSETDHPDEERSQFKARLASMTHYVFCDDYAQILMFYIYRTKDVDLIDSLVATCEAIFQEYPVARLEEDLHYVNSLYGVAATPIEVDDQDIERNRMIAREEMDVIEASNALIFRSQDRIAYSQHLDPLKKIAIALKCVMILGQIIRNFPGSLLQEIKVRVAHCCYRLGFRVLSFALSTIEANYGELKEYYARIIHRSGAIMTPRELGTNSEEAIIAVCELWCFGIVKNISLSVGSDDLEETFRALVLKEEGSVAVQLTDIALKLDFFRDFPEVEIDRASGLLKRNHVCLSVLRHLVSTHFAMFRTSHRIRQKYSDKLQLKVKTISGDTGGLVKDEEGHEAMGN